MVVLTATNPVVTFTPSDIGDVSAITATAVERQLPPVSVLITNLPLGDKVYNRHTAYTYVNDYQIAVEGTGTATTVTEYTSLDPTVATVNDTGFVSLVTPGTAKINMVTPRGSFSKKIICAPPAPASARAIPLRYQTGTLGKAINDYLFSLILPNKSKNMFTPAGVSASTRNPNFWLNVQGLDFTGMSFNAPWSHVITPRHIVSTNHWYPGPNQPMIFITNDNQQVVRNVAASGHGLYGMSPPGTVITARVYVGSRTNPSAETTITTTAAANGFWFLFWTLRSPDDGYNIGNRDNVEIVGSPPIAWRRSLGDVRVMELDSDLPASIRPFKLLPANFLQYFAPVEQPPLINSPTRGRDVYTLSMCGPASGRVRYDRTMFMQRISQIATQLPQQYHDSIITTDTGNDVTGTATEQFYANLPTTSEYSWFWENRAAEEITTGDSSTARLMVIEGTVCLIGPNAASGSFILTSEIMDRCIAAIGTTGYTTQQLTLTGTYPTYA